ncbi:MAG: TlpA family protein disulfide reductase [Magnetococcales bacterium]|nr:TlpA family protein disulfide reductase [Magnetococcales bacterium]
MMQRFWRVIIVLLALVVIHAPMQANAEPPPGLDIELTTLEGKSVRLSDYQGKIVVVNFWATWCPPCRDEIPDLVKFYNEYVDRGVVVLGVDFMERPNQKKLEGFQRKYKMTYPIVYGETGDLLGLARALGGVYGLPTTVFLNQDGKRVRTVTGGINDTFLKQIVDGLL